MRETNNTECHNYKLGYRYGVLFNRTRHRQRKTLFLVFTENFWGKIQFTRLLRNTQKMGVSARGVSGQYVSISG